MGATVTTPDLRWEHWGLGIAAGTLRPTPSSNLNSELRPDEQIRSDPHFEGIVGQSSALRQVLQLVERVAPSDSTVLLLGETGTGKELIARALHLRSRRKDRPLVRLNCAAIPSGLLESELFGHERGAFTGAITQKMGRLELADQGTLFLDEVGDIPLELQSKLLRVLQEQEFERLGSTRTMKVNVRLVAATHRDLESMMAEKQFRTDLYYRLNVFPIRIPPLRERREDIPRLLEYFIDRYTSKAGNIHSIEKKTLDLLQSYPWPGNIRELQNVIERSVIECETETLSVDASWLSPEPAANPPASQPLSELRVTDEKQLIEAALAKTRGRVSGRSGAAVMLGMPASTLESKIRSLKISKYRFKTL